MSTEAQPIRSFRNSHAGIISQLDRLSELPALLAPAELAKKTADAAVKFFRKAVFAHHADEEKVLFPAVIESAMSGDERKKVQTMVKALTAQHRNLETLWSSIEPELKKVAKGSSHSLQPQMLERLVELYRAHADYEETEFLPLSQQILSRNDNHMEALDLSLHMHHLPLPIGHV
jgi:hemerythrin-like domain-containing protein